MLKLSHWIKEMLMRNCRQFVTAILAVIVLTGIVQAKPWADEWAQRYLSEDEKTQDTRTDLAVTSTTAATTKYMWRGFNMMDNHAAIQPSINVDWYGTGLSTTVWDSIPLEEGMGDAQEMRYIVGYTDCLWGDAPHATKYTVSWTYYDFVSMPSTERDAEEIGRSFVASRVDIRGQPICAELLRGQSLAGKEPCREQRFGRLDTYFRPGLRILGVRDRRGKTGGLSFRRSGL